ncbi:MAG: hypothetical protein RL174_429 [Actinomycetota bacterium]
MIAISNLTFFYADAEKPAIRRANLQIEDGEFVLLTGPTGSGKTSLLMAIAGLAPSFTGGTVSGSILIDGQEFLGVSAQNLADRVAFLNQQPESSFVAESADEEIAFGLELFGVEPADIRVKIDDVATLLGIENLLSRPNTTLSGGEQQKVAIAAAIVGDKKILLLDEPTSALDSEAADAVISALCDLNQKHGYTVIVSEHRIDQLIKVVDSVATVNLDGTLVKASAGTPEFALATSTKFNWPALRPNSEAEIIALMGANGSGKTTLLWQLQKEFNAVLVPQRATDLLFLQSLKAEFAESDEMASKETGATSAIFESLVGRIDPAIHPRDLSAGQQLALGLAVQLVRDENLILLDEPTRGLDQKAKRALAMQLRLLQSEGKQVIIATHDKNFAEAISDRIVKISAHKLSEPLEIFGQTITGATKLEVID